MMAVVATVTETSSFSPAFVNPARVSTQVRSSLAMDQSVMEAATLQQSPQQQQQETSPTEPTAPAPQKQPKRAPKSQHSQKGVFAPVVLLAKDVLGEEQLNKVRAKAISLHSDVISNFVDTSNSAFGQTVLKALFNVVDTNRNGVVDEEELAQALTKLGFEWLKDKQVKGIFERADRDNNGRIDLEEWITEAPKTLRTNLIKLAKKNGGELGFLA
jgi:EF-hand domain pair